MRSNDLHLIAVLALSAALPACGTPPAAPAAPVPAEALDATVDAFNGPGHNGLSARSLLFNAITQNPRALRMLMDHPLDDALFDAQGDVYLRQQLADANARDVMSYIVSCALGRSDRVRYVDPEAHAVRVWAGEMGLCPEWHTQRMSESCARLVSSCLFARTNRLHSWVPVRFGGPNLPAPADRVDVTTRYMKGDVHAGVSEGTEIPAFSRGWHPGYVGSCSPGEPITLAIPAQPRCARTAVRVCGGIRGCQPGSAGFVREVAKACDNAPATFRCPKEGFYGVMTQPGRVAVVQRGASAGSYPAPEKEVFPFLEGAFFGNLFDPDGLLRVREVTVDKGQPRVADRSLNAALNPTDDAIPHRHIYACYSMANDEQAVAYLNARICAKPGSERCFPNPPRRCHFKDTTVNDVKGYHCEWLSGPGVYRQCQGEDDFPYPTITVYLNEPCALSADGCKTDLSKAPAPQ
jgi:hypothetical protein